jgi:hypothetical protein
VQVLGDDVLDRDVAADARVRGAAEQQVLADAEAARAVGSGAAGAARDQQQHLKHALEALPRAHGAVARDRRHQIGAIGLEARDRVGQRRRPVDGVGVGEQQEVAGRDPGAGVARPGLAQPAGR